MSKRTEVETTENKHGSLDADASARLEDLLDAAKRGGLDLTAGEVLSKAVRIYHEAACGRLEVMPIPREAQSVN